MTLSVIIANHNTRDILKSCLENLLSIKKEISLEFEIIVVDNGSTDESAELVENKFSNVILLKEANKGISYGYNQGIKRAKGNYYLFLGTDAFPTKESLEGITKYMEKNRNVGIATAKLVLRDKSLDMDAHRGFPTPWAAITHFSKISRLFNDSTFFNSYYLGGLTYADSDSPHEIDLCISHFMFVRASVVDKIGLWDEDFFVYGEDVDFCYRVKQAGFKIMYLPEWQVVHYKGVSVGRKESKDIKTASNQSKKTKKRMRKETTRAMRLFYQKHYKEKYPKVLTSSIINAINILGFIRNKLQT